MTVETSASRLVLALLACLLGLSAVLAGPADPFVPKNVREKIVADLTVKYGPAHAERARRGVNQAADLWRAADGTADEFAAFCDRNFIGETEMLRKTFARLEVINENIGGFLHQLGRALKEPLDLDRGDPLPVDFILAEYSPYAHLGDDFFANKLAFYVIINFPNYTLAEKLQLGPGWDREQWAMVRLGDKYTARVPAEVNAKSNAAAVAADHYISEYNIYMGNLLTPDGKTLFPEKLKLISHWNLRDELKGQYANADGLPRQEMIFRVMERIIDQTIPAVAINNPVVRWEPYSDKVYKKDAGVLTTLPYEPEKNVRYRKLLDVFQAQKLVDPCVPAAPTLIDRRFNQGRQIPEGDVERLLTSLTASPLAKEVGALIEKRLGRKLRPFDIWYDGFKARSAIKESDLDQKLQAKYPTAQAFQADLPNILRGLGFTPATVAFLSQRIVVDPSRGPGHAMGAEMRSDCAHLRTRVVEGGMNYKGYNIAIHELGHNVEQVFSLHGIDHVSLQGVPNTAFTECFAFLFQARDLELLGIKDGSPLKKHLDALDTYWGAYEISGVALVDMKVWRWLYAHPDANEAALKDAVIAIAREVWNRYYAPVFGVKDCSILAIYSHMIDAMLYLPDYPMGHIISFQLEKYMEGKDLGQEMERMCKQGDLTPRQWMMGAVGSDISTAPILEAVTEALKVVK